MKEYILWLPSWYPGRTDPFNGDFIERHARAVSAFVPVIIIAVAKDFSLKSGTSKVEKEVSGLLTVYRGYYGPARASVMEKFHSTYQYHSLQYRIFSQVRKEHGLPALVHVHVAWKAGVLARILQYRFSIPYLVTEHWTGYYKESPNSVYKSGFLQKWATKNILKHAEIVLPVAGTLGKTIQKFTPVNYTVIPNVVDTNLFVYKPPAHEKFRFLHVSAMGYVKNVEGIIQAAISLQQEGFDFELKMIGANRPDLESMAADAGLLNQSVFFESSVPYEKIAVEMQQASVFVLFSRFENMPCVILESLCCGLPVISTDVGGIAEVITKSNGVLIESEDEEGLKLAMKKMIRSKDSYDGAKIAKNTVGKYSFPVIGKQIIYQYEKILKKEIKS